MPRCAVAELGVGELTDIDDLRSRVALIVSGPKKSNPTLPPDTPQSDFSAFNREQVGRATALASRLMEIADAQGGDEGLAAAVQEMERLLETEIPGLVQHAVKLFLAHHREAGERLMG